MDRTYTLREGEQMFDRLCHVMGGTIFPSGLTAITSFDDVWYDVGLAHTYHMNNIEGFGLFYEPTSSVMNFGITFHLKMFVTTPRNIHTNMRSRTFRYSSGDHPERFGMPKHHLYLR